MNEYLSKEEELELGRLIQKGMAAKKKLKDIENGVEKSIKGSKFFELEREIEAGDEAAVTLVENNKRLVYDIANKFKRKYPAGPHIDDVIGDGMVGLWVAVEKYDPTRGYKFSTMAFNWISQSIARGSNKTSRLVRLPENRITDFIHISRVRREIESKCKEGVDVDALVREKLGLTQKEYSNIINAATAHTSLNKVVGSDENGVELHNYIDNHTPSAESALIGEVSYGTLYGAIDQLDELEKEVLYASCKMSVDGSKPKTAKSVKAERNLTATQYKNILNGAIKKVRSEVEVEGFEYSDYDFS